MDIIKAIFWEKPNKKIGVSKEEYEELKKHAIEALAAPILSELEISQELYADWELLILRQISHYTQYCHAQNHIPLTVPFVILKGTAAAQYYLHHQTTFPQYPV